MRPRRFYFVRHGETILNAQHIRQGTEGGLSEIGKQQADRLGQYLKHFWIRKIITSTYPRAEETAAIINNYLKVPIIPSELLVERRNPTEVIGKKTSDPDVERIKDQMDLAYHDDDFRYSDEENFLDLRTRADTCLRYLARQQSRQVVVITHHVFLKMIVAYMLYRKQLHAKDFVKLSYFNWSDNGGITVCEFHPWKILSSTRGWEVVTYNEQLEPEKKQEQVMS